MTEFEAIIKRFNKNGEKTGWTYIEIPFEIAEKIKPNTRTSYRVKGFIDGHEIAQVALVPMGEGDFIIALNGEMRKHLKKQVGDKVKLQIAEETEEMPLSVDLMESLALEPEALAIFSSFPKGHQRYYSNYVDTAKSFETKSKRLYMIIYGLLNKMDYGQMIRHFKSEKDKLNS